MRLLNKKLQILKKIEDLKTKLADSSSQTTKTSTNPFDAAGSAASEPRPFNKESTPAEAKAKPEQQRTLEQDNLNQTLEKKQEEIDKIKAEIDELTSVRDKS